MAMPPGRAITMVEREEAIRQIVTDIQNRHSNEIAELFSTLISEDTVVVLDVREDGEYPSDPFFRGEQVDVNSHRV
jgi:hypothetical protein